MSLGYILKHKDKFILNDRSVVPETLSKWQWICVDILNVCACGVHSDDESLLLSNVQLVVTSQDHNFALSYLYGCIGSQWHGHFIRLKDGIDNSPFPFDLIIDLDD